jgi:hypothetical protein
VNQLTKTHVVQRLDVCTASCVYGACGFTAAVLSWSGSHLFLLGSLRACAENLHVSLP